MANHVLGLSIFGLCAALLGVNLMLIARDRFVAPFVVTGIFMAAVFVVALLIRVPAAASFFSPGSQESRDGL